MRLSFCVLKAKRDLIFFGHYVTPNEFSDRLSQKHSHKIYESSVESRNHIFLFILDTQDEHF